MAANPFFWGNFYFRCKDGYEHVARGGFNYRTEQYHVHGSEGTYDPWQYGGDLASKHGSIIKMWFEQDKEMGKYFAMLHEITDWERLYGLQALLRRLAPVNIREVYAYELPSSPGGQ